MKTPFVVISGPSGVGKTTAIKRVSTMSFKGFTVHVPQKVTNRAAKPSDNPAEMRSVSSTEYETLKRNNSFVLTYQRHGNDYGLLKEDTASDRTVYLTAIPASVVAELHDLPFDFTVIRLVADADTIIKRQQIRGDTALSDEERASRVKTAYKALPQNVDHTVDAMQPPELVAESIAALIQEKFGR